MAFQDQFQQILGRAPSPDEAAFFQKFLSEGSIQPHEIGQILQATPEYQQSQLTKNAADFGTQLNAQNESILNQAGAAANSRFASLGRPVTSAQGASVLQAGGQLAQQRQSALASFYGQGLQNNAALGVQQGAGALERGYGMRDETRQFGQQLQLARYNQNNYNDYLNQANRRSRSRALTGFAGAAGGALIGGLVPGGGVAAAGLGAGLGGQAGGFLQ